MSAALSAAKKRRAPIAEQPKIQQQTRTQTPQQSSQSAGLSLTQVIALVDSRLTSLETKSNAGDSQFFDESIEEIENRFEILAQEISELKQTILSLQTYTMEVNKILYDERKSKMI